MNKMIDPTPTENAASAVKRMMERIEFLEAELAMVRKQRDDAIAENQEIARHIAELQAKLSSWETEIRNQIGML